MAEQDGQKRLQMRGQVSVDCMLSCCAHSDVQDTQLWGYATQGASRHDARYRDALHCISIKVELVIA